MIRDTLWMKRQILPFLAAKGIDVDRPFRCLNPAHEDLHPSMRLHRAKWQVHCFSCGVNYDLYDLLQLDYNLPTPGAAFQKAAELFGTGDGASPALSLPVKRAEDYLSLCRAGLSQCSYFEERGLSPALCRRYGLGYDPDFDAGGGKRWQAVIIPTGAQSYIARNIDPSAAKEDRYRKSRGGAGLFNAAALARPASVVFVCEGELDALSILELGFSAVALGGTQNAETLKEACDPSTSLLLVLDQDAAGQRASRALRETLRAAGLDAQVVDVLGGAKDPNEALCADRNRLERALEEALQTVPQGRGKREKEVENFVAFYPPVSRQIDGFLASISTVPGHLLPTGFSKLDDLLRGGLFPGLYVLGAMSSLGKTTLLLQLADQLAAQGQPVLFYSLEMPARELMAKSLCRLSWQGMERGEAPLSARDILCGAPRSPAQERALERALEVYRGLGEQLYLLEGEQALDLERIERETATLAARTPQPPVVMLDYLQLLGGDGRASDKQNVDRVVLFLKRLSRRHNCVVMAVSSLNRQGYTRPVGMDAFKESGAIEYSSDVLLGLQPRGIGRDHFDFDRAQRRDPREVELRILKNRGGEAGGSLLFEYYAPFHAFVEAGDGGRGR